VFLRRARRACTVAATVGALAVCRSVDGAAQQAPPNDAARVALDPESMPRPTLRAVRIDRPIELDGRLDDAAWATAEVASEFIQTIPATGLPATQRTEVRVLYDDAQLYFGAMVYDTETDGIIRKGLRRDFASTEDDIFGVALDTYLDKRNAFYFFINPNGAIRDSQAFDNSRISGTEWDGVIHVRTALLDDGWSVEVAVPFSTLRFDPSSDEQTWGVNFLRRVRRNHEDAHWAPVDRRSQIHRMALAGTLTGLSGIAAGRNLTVKPYLKAEDAAGAAAGSDDPFDGGLDVKYGLTSRMTLDATWRTDFSQVEVDQQQVNLTRFPLFFPEKRGFFIENTGTFAFGDVSERNVRLGASPSDFTLFHSRRIGLEGGQPIGIEGGARLTGRAGGMELGLMTMQTESAGSVPAENFAVARARGGVGAVDLGGMFLNRQSTIDSVSAYNRSWGVDANARLWSNLLVHSYLAGSDEPGQTGDPLAGRLSVAWRDQLWDLSALYRHIGDGFDPGIGYVRRTAIDHGYATVGAHPRVPIPYVSEINPYVEAEYIADLDGELETRGWTGGMDVDFLDAATLSLSLTDRFERIDRSFGALGATVPVGRYDFSEWGASYASNASKELSGRLSVSGGGYYNGSRRTAGVAGTWKPSSHVTLELSGQRNRLTFAGQPFTAELLGARLSYDLSTTLFGSALVQYDDLEGVVVSNVRLNWVHAPLSDLFLVYTERRSSSGGPALDRRVTLKVTRLFAL
jgi:hypothetical protein